MEPQLDTAWILPLNAAAYHHPDLYFNDGNIVLSSSFTDEKPIVLFRVHKSVLAKQSPVFSDMFTLPEDESGLSLEMEAGYQGAQFISMPDDKDDLECFLKAIYQPLFLSTLQPFSPDTPSIIRGALKLATKYQMDDMRHAIISRLEYDWPQTLAQWDAVESRAETLIAAYRAQGPTSDSGEGGLYPDDQMPEPASAIRLARECNIPSILPAALYHLSRLSPGNDWDKTHALRTGEGSPDPNSSTSSTPNGTHNYTLGLRTARWNILQVEDFICLLKARESSSHEIGIAPIKLRSLVLCSDDCLNQATVLNSFCWHPFDPLKYLAEKYNVQELKRRGVCEKCARAVEKLAQERRERFWKMLPALCGISKS